MEHRTEPLGGVLLRVLERVRVDAQGHGWLYAHGRPVALFGKGIFDARSTTRTEFMQFRADAPIGQVFSQQVLGPAQVSSLISVAQATVELTTVYPSNIELHAAAIRAWNELHNSHLLVNAIWNMHTKAALGIVSRPLTQSP